MNRLTLLLLFVTAALPASAPARAIPVTFRYQPKDAARSVTVAGSFNGWNKSANPMTKADSGAWTATLDLEPGPVQYKFVVNDDTWVSDPNAGPPLPPDGNSLMWVVPSGESSEHAMGDGKILGFAVKAGEPVRVAKDRVRFTLTTAANDVTTADLWVMKGPAEGMHAMERASNDGATDTFSVTLPVTGAVRYTFFVADAIPAGSSGARAAFVSRMLDADGLHRAPFPIDPSGAPLTDNDVKPFTLDVEKMPFLVTPAWVPNTVWYQVFPERFANGSKANDTKPPKGVPDWNTPLSAVAGNPNDHWWGGDLQGVIDKLPYLQKLGVSGIYLNPIFEGPDTHLYATTDYLKIAPQLGDEATLKRLVKVAHKAGIRVMLDGVFNHTSVYFFAFQDILKNQEKSKYKDWYHIKSFPVLDPTKNYTEQDGKPLPYDGWWGIKWMPKLNTDNPETAAYLLKVATYWIKNADIDGWRLDVANEVSQNYWRKFRTAVKGAKPDAVIIGEVWDNASQWLKGDEFDAVMNYPFRGAVLDFAAHGKTDAKTFAGQLDAVRGWYPPAANAAMFNLLGSHDTARLLTEAGRDAKRAGLAVLFQMTYPGAPSIYYGDEVGMEGGNDPNNRAPMVWDRSRWNMPLHEVFERAVALRNAHPALRGMDIETRYAHGQAVAFLRKGGGETAVTAFNAGDTEQTLAISLPEGAPARWTDAWRGGSVTATNGIVSVTLPPLSSAVLVAEDGR
jgi:glycosidase